MPEDRQMPLLEALIIYLSAGAPFGVLVLFSQRSASTPIAAFNALLATLAWPMFGTYRLFRGIFRKRDRQVRSDADADSLDVLKRLSLQVPSDVAELFQIAGHSNPWVATNCYARARRKVLESHIDRISTTSVESKKLANSRPDEAAASYRIVTTIGT